MKRLAILLPLVVAACTTNATAMKQSPGPYPENYDTLIKSHLNETLKDPDSMKQFAMTKPVKGAVFKPYSGAEAAWVSCVELNAKNSFGGYVGLQRYAYFMQEDEIVNIVKPEDSFGQGQHPCF